MQDESEKKIDAHQTLASDEQCVGCRLAIAMDLEAHECGQWREPPGPMHRSHAERPRRRRARKYFNSLQRLS